MAKEWFVRQGGKVAGPFDSEKLKQLVTAGKLRDDAEVANDRNGPWHPKAKVKGLGEVQPTTKGALVSSPTSAPRPIQAVPVVVPQPMPEPTQIYVAPPIINSTVNVRVRNSNGANSLGISSMILGIGSFFVCWIPLVGFGLSGLGLLLGVVGFVVAIFRRGSGIGYSITGVTLNAISVGIGLLYATVIAGMISGIAEAAKRANETQQATPFDPETNSKPTFPESTAGTKANPESQPPQIVWHPADKPLKLGDMSVRVTEVVLGKVPLKGITGEGTSQEDLLLVRLEVTNLSKTKKVDYQGWSEGVLVFSGIGVSLTDDADNRYKRVNFGISTKIVGAQETESIYPGKALSDVVVFERPIDTAPRLYLKLSAEGMGQDGEFRFEIPKAMIRLDD